MGNKLQKIIVIVGPTSSGKSDLAVRLAKKFSGEVVSADSRQVYKGLDIGTGKITEAEMKEVPHHLLDVANPILPYSVALYKKHASQSLRHIARNGKLPIICGGTGFYIDTLLGAVSLPNVPANKKLRKILSEKSKDELLAILAIMDGERARTIDRRNPARLIRAIEIASSIGKVPKPNKQVKYDTLKIGIKVEPEDLKQKIATRLLSRIKKGMIEETKLLHQKGLSFKRMDELGLEYRHLAKYLKGEMTEQEMIEKIKIENWRYAKRQMTWFKRDKEIQWLKPDDLKNADKLVMDFLKTEQKTTKRL